MQNHGQERRIYKNLETNNYQTTRSTWRSRKYKFLKQIAHIFGKRVLISTMPIEK